MYRIRNIGWLVVGSVMLLLAACSGTPTEVSDPQKQIQEQPPQQLLQEQPLQEQPPQQPPQEQQPQEDTDLQEGVPPTAMEAAATVASALKNGDMSTLAAWVHPDRGVRFSPYAYVDTKKDIVFTRYELEGSMEDTTEREWRTFPGSGEQIKMTFAEYYKRFVYDADFIKDAKIAVNEVLGEGTTISNLNEVYPKDSYDFVEYHLDSIDPSAEGRDWRSLRLVFEKIGEDHALVGIIHDQWTP